MLTFAVLLFALSIGHAEFTYTNVNGAVTITGYTGTNNDVVIPSTIDELPVTYIGDFSFYFDSSLLSVTIPGGVTGIGHDAFAGSTSLTNVILPDGLTYIDRGAFAGCSSLTSITIPQSMTLLGGMDVVPPNTFADCINLTSVFFKGDAPVGGGYGYFFDLTRGSVFEGVTNATVYYLPGTTGWSTNFTGLPTAPWTLPYPVIFNEGLAAQSNHFGFTVSWATNASTVVEASTDLTNPKWSAVTTNALSGGTFYFSDPQSTKYPSRFYRVRSQ
jgi:hypothetical protein